MRIVDGNQRSEVISTAERYAEETLFQFAARIFGSYFSINERELNFFVRQEELTGNPSDARLYQLVRNMGTFFDLDKTEVIQFYKLLQLANKIPS